MVTNMDSEQRALRAKQLKDDAIFREVMDGLRNAAITAWTQTKTEEAKQRDFSWLMVKTLDRIDAYLDGIIAEQVITARATVRAPE